MLYLESKRSTALSLSDIIDLHAVPPSVARAYMPHVPKNPRIRLPRAKCVFI